MEEAVSPWPSSLISTSPCCGLRQIKEQVSIVIESRWRSTSTSSRYVAVLNLHLVVLWVAADEGASTHGEFVRRSVSTPSRYATVFDLHLVVLWVEADEGVGTHGEFVRRSVSTPSRYATVFDLHLVVL
jgi:hypothetical protein